MEPIHIHAMLHQKADDEVLREHLEQHFAARAEASFERRERIRTIRQRLSGLRAPVPVTRSAV